MKDNVKINSIVFFIEAITSEKLLRKEIDKIFLRDKAKYYLLAKKSKYYNNIFFTEGDIFKEEYSRKLLGIIEANNKKEVDDKNPIFYLLKKGWPDLYNYIKKNDPINFMKVYENFLLTRLNIYSDDKFNAVLFITLFLVDYFKKEVIENEAFFKTIETLKLREDNNSKYQFKYKNLSQNSIINSKEKLKIAENELGIEIKQPWDIFDTEKENIYYKFIDAFSFIFDAENLSFASLTNNITLTKKDIIEIGAAYYNNNNDLNKESLTHFISAAVILKSILKSYKQTKRYYFKNNKQTMYVEIEAKKLEFEKIKEKNIFLESKNKKLKDEIEYFKKNYKESLEREIIELQQKNKKKLEEISKLREDNKELVRIREALFERENENENYDNENLGSLPDTVKCMIVGGHENWQNKLKKEFPDNFKFIYGDSKNIDHRIFDKISCVFFYVDCKMSHTTYYKIINICKKQDIPFFYLNNTEVNVVKNEISKKMKNLIEK